MPAKVVIDPLLTGTRVRAVRTGLGLTVAEAARQCGIGHQSWTDLERGRSGGGKPLRASLDRLWSIATALGVDPHDLDPRLAAVKAASADGVA